MIKNTITKEASNFGGFGGLHTELLYVILWCLSQQIINQLKTLWSWLLYITPTTSNFQSLDFEAWVFLFFGKHNNRPDLTSRWQLPSQAQGQSAGRIFTCIPVGVWNPDPFWGSRVPIYPIPLSHQPGVGAWVLNFAAF